MSRRLRWALAAGLLLATLATLAVAIMALNLRGEVPLLPDAPGSASVDQVQRGAYLARAGNCAACHTARGGAAYAGGRGVATPFGTVYAGNLTPDADTGLGRWTQAEFWRALHHGRSRDGRLLYPAFPYAHFTQVSRADADALLAFLRSVAPVAQANRDHALRWPYSNQLALAVWRALYFRPDEFRPDTQRSAEWNRGAYLVSGLGHCAACHGSRDPLGATDRLDVSRGGSVVPMQSWYAPSLTDPAEAGLHGQSTDDWMRLLKTGVSARGSAQGPMAEVVAGSTQHLTQADLQAMATYLQSLAAPPPAAAPRRAARPADTLARGEKLYTRHCVDCHGALGQGAPGIYAPLRGNPTVTMDNPRNLVQAITNGGFAPATAGNPRPYGMPAFDLPHADLAALATWLRASWGHDAPPVSDLDVLLVR